MGLIPAHTGKTVTCVMVPSSLRAHPRAYGENLAEDDEPIDVEGSSPRIRGKQAEHMRDVCASGLIPAHTGKTLSVYLYRTVAGAHPRAYGENVFEMRLASGEKGSSPRIRGKH